MHLSRAQILEMEAELGRRTGWLIDRYHAMHVAPIAIKLDWHLRPWWQRLWLWIRGEKPDVDAIIQERMDELDSMVEGPCPSIKAGAPCRLGAGHEGDHERESFGGQIIYWSDEEADTPTEVSRQMADQAG